jgi:uncharacterized membrane protein
MKKHLLFCISAFVLLSCTQVNSNGEKTITQGEDTISSIEISTSKIDALNSLAEMDEEETSTLLFKAFGIEPGWFAEFYSNKLRLVVDYGKDSLVMDGQKFEGLDDKEGYVFSVQGDKDVSKNVGINIINKSCEDAGSGDKKDRTVIVTYKGKTYKGCGSFVK